MTRTMTDQGKLAVSQANSKAIIAIDEKGNETEYPSQTICAQALNIAPPRISRAIATGGSAGGYRFMRPGK